MNLKSLEKECSKQTKKKLLISLNENRSTMLSVKWEPKCTRVSLHKMFLEAPYNIMQELACYIGRKRAKLHPVIKTFIDTNWLKLDYARKIRKETLCTKGAVYDLEAIYQRVNETYFQGRLNLDITWFGNPSRRVRSKITFGSYHAPLRLIKINRVLDNPRFPPYVVEFVVYHEMVHHVCPAKALPTGKNSIHTVDFKEREKEFRHYKKAKAWIEENRNTFFIR